MANWSRLPHAAHMAHTAAALAFDSDPRQEAALSIWPQTYLVTCQKHLFPRSTVLDAEVTFVGSPAFWRKAEGYTQDGLLRSGARFPGSLPREERSCFAFFFLQSGRSASLFLSAWFSKEESTPGFNMSVRL